MNDKYSYSSSEAVHNPVYSPLTQYPAVEEDMRRKKGKSEIHTKESSDWIDQVYNCYPLLGNAILTPKRENQLIEFSGKIISQYLNYPERRTLRYDMILTLAIIQYAKEWDTDVDEGFWGFIAKQLGYPERISELTVITQKAVKRALTDTGHWFVYAEKGKNQFKSSILVHALSTKKTWMLFCDFLFDFYKENMDWQYIEMDPIIPLMTKALRQKLLYKETDELAVSSKIYSFQEGIKKLIVYRPGYFTHLADRMLKNIDQMINGEKFETKVYEEQLCKEWMDFKLQNISVRRRASDGERKSPVDVVDYTSIHPRFQLDENNKVLIHFSGARLPRTDFNQLYLDVYSQETIINRIELAFYGNELGKSMKPFTLDLEAMIKKAGIANIQLRFVIRTENEVIYDSEKSMYRDCLIFREKKEAFELHPGGEGYTAILLQGTNLKGDNFHQEHVESTSLFDIYYLEPHPSFLCLYGEKVIDCDKEQQDELWIDYPEEVKGCIWSNGIRPYAVLNMKSNFLIVDRKKEVVKKFRLFINGNLIEWEKLKKENAAEYIAYSLNLSQYGDTVHLELKDLQKEETTVEKYYKLLPAFEYRFERSSYIYEDDYINSQLQVRNENGCFETVLLQKAASSVQFPLGDGQVKIDIPQILIRNQIGQVYPIGQHLWHKDIDSECHLYINGPKENIYTLYFAGRELPKEKQGGFSLGNAVANGGCGESADIDLIIQYADGSKEKRGLGQIEFKERFVQKPNIFIHEDKLVWDQGQGFIGDKNPRLHLTIYSVPQKSFSLALSEPTIANEFELPTGIYNYEITLQTGGLFGQKKIALANGKLISGDEDQLWFEGQKVKLTKVRIEGQKGFMDRVIQPSYIENITFEGYEDFEGSRCPIYKGIMFYKDKNGKKIMYSFQEQVNADGDKIEKVNPVKMVRISETLLNVTNEDGDGFNYCEKGDGSRYGRRFITDRNPDSEETGETTDCYDSVDLLVYEREG